MSGYDEIECAVRLACVEVDLCEIVHDPARQSLSILVLTKERRPVSEAGLSAIRGALRVCLPLVIGYEVTTGRVDAVEGA